jgi:hypothetical protein
VFVGVAQPKTTLEGALKAETPSKVSGFAYSKADGAIRIVTGLCIEKLATVVEAALPLAKTEFVPEILK